MRLYCSLYVAKKLENTRPDGSLVKRLMPVTAAVGAKVVPPVPVVQCRSVTPAGEHKTLPVRAVEPTVTESVKEEAKVLP